MKKRIVSFLLVCIWVPAMASAIEFLYVGNKGFRHFSCGSAGRGAEVLVKPAKGGAWEIKSSRFSGFLNIPESEDQSRYCTGMEGAVRIICNICDWPPPNNGIEGKKRRLGLIDSE